jgi:hypothetical protein
MDFGNPLFRKKWPQFTFEMTSDYSGADILSCRALNGD